MLDVLIQTHNEELNLPHTLQSVGGWVNRIFVVDSGSTDRTREIAAEHGAMVVQKAWEGYARQKNWALANLPFESPWILILDADESVTPQLKDEILAGDFAAGAERSGVRLLFQSRDDFHGPGDSPLRVFSGVEPAAFQARARPGTRSETFTST